MVAVLLIPEWLTSEKYLTLATWGLVLCTLLLVVATLVVWTDSLRKGREQRERWTREDEQHKLDREEERARWKRDDELRSEEQRPKFTFGVELGRWPSDAGYTPTLWCSNLGSVAIHLKSAFVQRVFDINEESGSANQFNPQQIVKPGEMLHVAIPRDVIEGFLFDTDFELWLLVDAAHTSVFSDKQAFSFFFAGKNMITESRRGYYAARRAPCPKCGAVGIFDPEGITSVNELKAVLNRAMLELADSCPDHKSTLLSSVVDSEGRAKQFKPSKF